MSKWPASLPDYRWPDQQLSRGYAPQRWALAFIFHLSYLAGRLIGAWSKGPGSLLVIRTDGIGDAILFEPALRSLAEAFAGLPIQLWAPAPTCELFAAHPAVVRTQPVPRGAKAGNIEYFASIHWRAFLGWRLGRQQFLAAFYAVESPEPLGNWLLSSVRAAEKWYAPGDTENQFIWQRTRTATAATKFLFPREAAGHELLRNAHLGEQWGGAVSLVPQLYIEEHARLAAQSTAGQWRDMAAKARTVEMVGIMAGSATGVNAYPIESWATVIRSLWHSRRVMCILFGGPGDAARNDKITSLLGDIPHLRLSPETGLLTIAVLLVELDGFISMDTGLAHIALVQNVPTVVLANGGHPNRFFPWPTARWSITLAHRMPCEGCLCRCVLAEPECVTRIHPEDVVAAYASIVAERKGEAFAKVRSTRGRIAAA